MRVVIVDDEEMSCETLQILLERNCPSVNVVGTGNSVETGLEQIESLQPDLVFLDIEMPFGTGFDLLEKINYQDFEIIITTAHDQYAIKAIKFHALDYLLKPIDKFDLISAVEKAENRRQSKGGSSNVTQLINQLVQQRSRPDRIGLPTKDGLLFVEVREIIRCEASGNYTDFFLTNGDKVIVARPLKTYDELLSEYNFYRVHNSHLINLNHVKKYVRGEGGHIITTDNANVIVSRSRKDELLKRLATA